MDKSSQHKEQEVGRSGQEKGDLPSKQRTNQQNLSTVIGSRKENPVLK